MNNTRRNSAPGGFNPAGFFSKEMAANPFEEAGDRLNEGELISMIALLIFAGHETTSNLIGNGL